MYLTIKEACSICESLDVELIEGAGEGQAELVSRVRPCYAQLGAAGVIYVLPGRYVPPMPFVAALGEILTGRVGMSRHELNLGRLLVAGIIGIRLHDRWSGANLARRMIQASTLCWSGETLYPGWLEDYFARTGGVWTRQLLKNGLELVISNAALCADTLWGQSSV